MQKVLTTCAALFFASFLTGQSAGNFWKDVQENQIWLPQNAETASMPLEYRTLTLDLSAIRNHLRVAPEEGSAEAIAGVLQIELPLPDGSMETFKVWDSPVMHPELAAKFPMIRTFAGAGLTNPAHTVRLGYGQDGFHAILLTTDGGSMITPYATNQTQYYMSFKIRNLTWEGLDLPPTMIKKIPVEGITLDDDTPAGKMIDFRGGGEGALTVRRTYRFALACTGEYGSTHGGTVPTVMATLVTATNTLNSVLERDADIRLQLIANNDVLVHLNGAIDPYMNANQGAALLGQNEDVLNNLVGLTNFDVGHVFTNGCSDVGGVVSGSVCSAGKARGVTCHSNGNVANITMQIAAHEMGHQFTGGHTFSNCPGSETQLHAGSAVEPGSGSTLLSYAGLCGSNNVQNSSDPYYHGNTISEYWTYTHDQGGNICPTKTTTSNFSPEVTLPYTDGFSIPIGTPFELKAIATDANSDPLTYCWEQINTGPSVQLGSPVGTAPSFRSFLPVTSPVRVFPKMTTIVTNGSEVTEVLPGYARNLKFRCTVRDNNVTEGAGGVTWKDVSFNAVATSGPFKVTSPNTALTWEVGKYTEVTWDVANSNAAPVNCKNVNIRLSKDGGFTYPIILLANTPNDGSAFVVVPNELTNSARIRVEAADNIFFDISNANFTIGPPTTAGFSFLTTPEMGQVCLPESFDIAVQTSSLLGFAENVTLAVTGMPAGAVANFSKNPLVPGEQATITINMAGVSSFGVFNLTVTGTANSVPVAERSLVLDIVSSDFSALATTAPTNGAAGQTSLPTFQWNALPNAISYDIEIATSPLFGASVVDAATGFTGTSYTPAITLQDNTQYYWRIRATSVCMTGEYIDAASFHTISQTCTQQLSTGGAINISGIGLPRIASVINIPQAGTISDVNVKNVKGTHSAVAHIEFRLKSPAGDSIKLMSGLLCGSPQFNLGFDDQAAATSIPCPPNTGFKYKPLESLSFFNGQNVQGDWTMVVQVINNDGTGGSFTSWELEYCAALTPKSPYLVKNDTLAVAPNEWRLIYTNKLLVADDDTDPAQLQFTIVTNTEHGFVSRDGVQLGVGDHFTMFDVYASKVRYTNTNPAALNDYFTFSVNDGTGGFFGTPRFNLKIDPDAPPTATNDLYRESDVLLYPNPATSQVTVEFKKEFKGEATASILNVQGQQLVTKSFDGTVGKTQLNTGHLPAGVYMVQITTREGVVAKKLVIE